MKNLLLILPICFIINLTLSAQPVKVDSALVKRIDTMNKYDQLWRKEYFKVIQKQPSPYSQETIERKWAETDSLNEIAAKDIVNRYGFRGYDIAGDASERFWAIIQHCDDDIAFQERVLTLMKKEVAKNNASKRNYAYLTDRVLANKKQKQLYGTQIYTDPKTHKSKPFPLKYPKSVNALRKKMGLETEEEYLKSFK